MTAFKTLIVGLFILLLAACGNNYHPAPVPVDQPVANPSADWVQGCVDDYNNRVSDDYCDGPRAHYYPVWHPITPGYIMPAYGRPLYGSGWSVRGQRPAKVTNINVINHVNSSGGVVNRNGTGTGVTSSSKISGKPPLGKRSSVPPRTSELSSTPRGGLGATGTAKAGQTQTKVPAGSKPSRKSGGR